MASPLPPRSSPPSPLDGLSALTLTDSGYAPSPLSLAQQKNTVLNTPPDSPTHAPYKIIDIRRSKLEHSLKDDIVSGLDNAEGEKTLPTLLLYDEMGLKLFQEITYLDEYYLTNAEIAVLEEYAKEMAKRIPKGAAIVELGSGNLRKVSILLTALERIQKPVSYYALDLSLEELHRTLCEIPGNTYKHVTFYGLHGTYDDGKAWLQTCPEMAKKPRVILWLGSSIGNFDRKDAAEFVADFTRGVLRAGKDDMWIVGMDGCKDEKTVWEAYNDSKGVTREFELNGLRNANGIMGRTIFEEGVWEYEGRWNKDLGAHEAFYRPLKDVILEIDGKRIEVKKYELVRIERSYKFDEQEALDIVNKARLAQSCVWASPCGRHSLRLLYPPAFHFTPPASYPLPTEGEFEMLWKAWDFITLRMLPQNLLHAKPIDLRNDCIFYLGHIPTFLDIQLSKSTQLPPTLDKGEFYEIFERGIDPDIDNPEKCHPHSVIPSSWPELKDILHFRDEVRKRARSLYRIMGEQLLEGRENEHIGRSLWMSYEHEAMHLETFLYMLIQVPQNLPPPEVPVPDFAALHRASGGNWTIPLDARWVKIPSTTVTHGTHHGFSWDNERPVRTSGPTKPFLAQPNPITVSEYASFLFSLPPAERAPFRPKTWNEDSSCVKTFFGPVPIKHAANWPVYGSYEQIEACAAFLGGRLPTRDELMAIFAHAHGEGKEADNNNGVLAKKINGVNSHLLFNGVRETPPVPGLFAFHPTALPAPTSSPSLPSTPPQTWEWTSTPLVAHEGFEADPEYPGYTADFFDGKHKVVLGGGWATAPRLRRKGFVNWYQGGYGFAWVGGRVVKDV